MRGIVNRLRVWLPLIGLALIAFGCEIMPDPQFSSLKDTLTLKIVEAKRSTGDSFEFSWELANRGSTSAKACLGPSRSVDYHVDYEGGSQGGISGDFVDHAGCTREFTIEPGSTMTWAETRQISDLREGRLEVAVRVQITNPNRCGSWGNCMSFDVESNRVHVP
jgi:hypothetical protein